MKKADVSPNSRLGFGLVGDEKFFRQKAEQEDGCCVSAGNQLRKSQHDRSVRFVLISGSSRETNHLRAQLALEMIKNYFHPGVWNKAKIHLVLTEAEGFDTEISQKVLKQNQHDDRFAITTFPRESDSFAKRLNFVKHLDPLLCNTLCVVAPQGHYTNGQGSWTLFQMAYENRIPILVVPEI